MALHQGFQLAELRFERALHPLHISKAIRRNVEPVDRRGDAWRGAQLDIEQKALALADHANLDAIAGLVRADRARQRAAINRLAVDRNKHVELLQPTCVRSGARLYELDHDAPVDPELRRHRGVQLRRADAQHGTLLRRGRRDALMEPRSEEPQVESAVADRGVALARLERDVAITIKDADQVALLLDAIRAFRLHLDQRAIGDLDSEPAIIALGVDRGVVGAHRLRRVLAQRQAVAVGFF